MTEAVRGHRWAEVEAAIADDPAILAIRDERGRNWLHIACMAVPGEPNDSIRTVDVLLAHYGMDDPAFTEGAWKATPLWHAISRGRNLALAEHLLTQGCDPDYCLFAAAWNEDREAIRLLIAHGAKVDDGSSAGETPLIGAVGWSRFGPAEELLEAGADPDFRDRKGMTALHYMLKKGSDKAHFAMFVAHGARGDIPDAKGETAAAIMRRKRDPDFHAIADRLAIG